MGNPNEIDLESQLPLGVIMAGSPIPSPHYSLWSARPSWIDAVPDVPQGLFCLDDKCQTPPESPPAKKVLKSTPSGSKLGLPKRRSNRGSTLSRVPKTFLSPRSGPAKKISPRSVVLDMDSLTLSQRRAKTIPFIQD